MPCLLALGIIGDAMEQGDETTKPRSAVRERVAGGYGGNVSYLHSRTGTRYSMSCFDGLARRKLLKDIIYVLGIYMRIPIRNSRSRRQLLFRIKLFVRGTRE